MSPNSAFSLVARVALRLPLTHGRLARARKEDRVDEEPGFEHPKGALLFMLIYLLTLTALWLNAYMRLWRN